MHYLQLVWAVPSSDRWDSSRWTPVGSCAGGRRARGTPVDSPKEKKEKNLNLCTYTCVKWLFGLQILCNGSGLFEFGACPPVDLLSKHLCINSRQVKRMPIIHHPANAQSHTQSPVNNRWMDGWMDSPPCSSTGPIRVCRGRSTAGPAAAPIWRGNCGFRAKAERVLVLWSHTKSKRNKIRIINALYKSWRPITRTKKKVTARQSQMQFSNYLDTFNGWLVSLGNYLLHVDAKDFVD